MTKEGNYTTESQVYFYSPQFYVFDNFSAYSVKIWGHVFPTSEHAYQWKKYINVKPDLAEKIRTANSPSAVKKISDANKEHADPDFYSKKVSFMEEIIRMKVTQHEKAQKALQESEDKEIIENSPVDSFWGIGPDGDGENHLGKIWMRMRNEFSTHKKF